MCHVETFTEARPFVEDHDYEARRRHHLDELDRLLLSDGIDTPIVPIIERISRIPYCFTLQSCYGHFVCRDGTNGHSVKEIPIDTDVSSVVRYRIAYVAFCIQNNASGHRLFEDLKAIPDADPEYIQFGSAGWFWSRCVNSFALQIEPVRCAFEDSLEVGIAEAVLIEATRDEFFSKLDEITNQHIEQLK